MGSVIYAKDMEDMVLVLPLIKPTYAFLKLTDVKFAILGFAIVVYLLQMAVGYVIVVNRNNIFQTIKDFNKPSDVSIFKSII